MKLKDWVFFAIFIFILFGVALFFDTVLHLIQGYYMIISGIFYYVYRMRARIMKKENTTSLT